MTEPTNYIPQPKNVLPEGTIFEVAGKEYKILKDPKSEETAIYNPFEGLWEYLILNIKDNTYFHKKVSEIHAKIENKTIKIK